MSRDDNSRAPDIQDSAKSEEEHMRNVLHGLGGKGGRAVRSTPQAHAPAGRHRFAQDGDVPVVRLSLARTETREAKRPAAAPEPMATDSAERDRAARHAAERAVHDITTTLHGVQTRLGHAELDLQQALSQVQARDQELHALRDELRARSEELAAARHALEGPRRRLGHEVRSGWHEGEADQARTNPLGDDTPEPVKWWRD